MPLIFLPYIGKRIKADKETIVKSLEGNWRAEHLFTLGESYKMYLRYRDRLQFMTRKLKNNYSTMKTAEMKG